MVMQRKRVVTSPRMVRVWVVRSAQNIDKLPRKSQEALPVNCLWEWENGGFMDTPKYGKMSPVTGGTITLFTMRRSVGVAGSEENEGSHLEISGKRDLQNQ